MSQVDKSKRPFYDTHDPSDGYHDVLFIPKTAVQTRELNEIQSLFHQQMEYLGDSLFEEGSIVIPGNVSYDLAYSYVTLDAEIPDSIGSFSTYINANNIVIESYTTGLKARIVGYEDETESGDPKTAYLMYLNSGTSNTRTFADDETLRVYNDTDSFNLFDAVAIGSGVGSKITVSAGVYYLNSKYVLVPEQTIPIDKYSTTPTKTVGFEYQETIVTPEDDSKLYDNAQDVSNTSAPGAYRLKVDAVLTSYDSEEDGTDDYIEIFSIKEGRLQKMARGPSYSVLGDTLAKRTYDESGNYSVEGFSIDVREHLKATGNRGLHTAEAGGDESKFVSQIGSGLAYIKGYEARVYSTQPVEHDKARSTEVDNNYSISTKLGYYIVADSITYIPDIRNYEEVEFLDESDAVVGTGRVKSISYTSGVYNVYLFDMKDATGKVSTNFVSSVRGIESVSGATTFSATISEENAVIRGTDSPDLFYTLSYEYVRSLVNPDTGETDTSFSIIRQFETSTDSSGDVILSAPTNGTFLAQSSNYSFASFTDVSGDVVDFSGNVSLGGTPLGKTMTVSFGAGYESRPVRMNVLTSINEATTKTKTVNTSQVTKSIADGKYALDKADAIRITYAEDDDGNDVTDLLTLNKNIRSSYYGISYATTGSVIADPITIDFEYFSHGSGDYFSVDSYNGIDYEDIPVVNGVRYTDIVDFRPRIDDTGTNFTGSGSSKVVLPAPNMVLRTDIEYYVPRYDKIVITENATIKVVKGYPSLNPRYPETPSNTMALYQLVIPAYTLDVGKIKTNKVTIPRYTMEDIGRLEDRMDKLDYYVSLSLLEKDAADMQIIDPVTGLNRFKNGFLVDPFTDHTVGDYDWSEYHCAIGDGELRPEMRFNAVDFEANMSTLSGVVVNDGIMTLAYEEDTFLNQAKRSDYLNVNPYAVFRWEGSINLDPSVDNWVDVVYTTPRIITRTVTRNATVTDPSQAWRNDATVLSSSSSSSSVTIEPHAQFVNPVATDHGATTTASTTTTTTTTTTLSNTSSSTSSSSGGDNVVDNEWLPFMRSREVEVVGEGHKPETKLNFFFDNNAVNQYIRPVDGDFGEDIVTDAEGSFVCVFNVPNNDELQIPVGTKLFVATDYDETRRELSLSWGETEYTATSRRETRQRTVIRTTVRTIETATVTDTSSNTVSWWDPLAQSFLVEEEGGIFVTKLDLFFLSKDENIPVHVDIREMENGMPTQNIIPGSRTLMKPSDVNESEDGSVATTFTFKYPVYLEQGREYCFMIWANSINYNAFIARMGEKDMGSGKYIAKQPYLGVLFKSQNSSTWTAVQDADLQFTLYKAKFGSNGNATLVNRDLATVRYSKQVLQSETGSSTITMTMDKHNYVVGSAVTLSGVQAGNGFTESALNATHIITEIVDFDTVKFVIDSETADSTGVFGGNAVEASDTCIASFMNLNCNDVNYSDTSITYTAKGMTGKSIDGEEIPYQLISDSMVLEKGAMQSLKRPWMITNKVDEGVNFGGNNSMEILASLTTDNENVSPVIDMYAYNLICPYYMIDGKVDDVVPDGSNTYTKYRTSIAGLVDPAVSIRSYVDTIFDENSDVILSCRVGNNVEEVEASDWLIMNKLSDVVTTNDQMTEIEYYIEEDDGLPEYTYFQVMIQVKSKGATRVPVCRNFRTICLGT